MGDLLFNDRAVDVISAEQESKLGYFFSKHDPVGLDVVDIVKKDPADCHGLQVVNAGGVGAFDFRVLRVIGKGDECLKAFSPVLEAAQPRKMIDPVRKVPFMVAKYRISSPISSGLARRPAGTTRSM